MNKNNLLMPWGPEEKIAWFNEQKIQRSYINEVCSKIEELKSIFDLSLYGTLSSDQNLYPVYFIKTKNFSPLKKTILITGGVHGYETSGVHGAIAFMSRRANDYSDKFNLICAPCISPWAYETINRWNPNAIDPNRSFYPDSPAPECRIFLNALSGIKIHAHFDLHETTDTDNTVFRIALQNRDAVAQESSEIPDGFYVVGDSCNPKLDFQKAIIASVKKITHIAPPDANGNIIGVPLESEGVVYYDMKKLFLCGGFAGAEYSTTTEVYPDSPKVTDAICVDAQVASIVGGLDYILNLPSN